MDAAALLPPDPRLAYRPLGDGLCPRRLFIAIRASGVHREANYRGMPKLEQQMGAVAERRIAGILAAAEQRALGALGGEHQGLDACAGMGAVAKRLLLASPAAAPGIALSCFELDLIGAELRPFQLGHALASHMREGGYWALLSQFLEAAQGSVDRPVARTTALTRCAPLSHPRPKPCSRVSWAIS